MARDKEQNPDRRLVITTAVVASAAAPLLGDGAHARAAETAGCGSKFMIRFDGYELPGALATKLAAEIHEAAVRTITVAGARLVERPSGSLPRRWVGGWWEAR